jgi:15-cis-phytoene synthase
VNSEPAPQPSPSARNASRYLAWLYSTLETQPLLQTLLAIEGEVRGVLRPGLEHRVAHVRLEWWSAEAERLASGQPAHPLTRALPSPAPNIQGLIDTAVWDLAAATFSTRAEVAGYCDRWATAMTQPLAPGNSRARALGAVIREIELLSGLASEARSGRLRLPLDELASAAIPVEALAKPPWPAKLCAVLVARHRELRRVLANHIAEIAREEQSALRGLLVWAALAARQSRRAEKALPNELISGRATLLFDTWVAWRSAHRAQNGRTQIGSLT